MQPREVATVVEAYLEEAARLGPRTVRIIFGRGIGAQRAIVRSILEHAPVSFEELLASNMLTLNALAGLLDE